MTRTLGNELPDTLRQLLDGAHVGAHDGSNPTFLLVTTDDTGWPHIALLSVGELVAIDSRTLRAGLWLGSTTTRNLSGTARALLAVVADGGGLEDVVDALATEFTEDRFVISGEAAHGRA